MQRMRHTVSAFCLAFVLSAIVGQSLTAQCTQDCKEVGCHSLTDDFAWKCTFMQPQSCWSELWVRDPHGGACVQTPLGVDWQKCPDCNPECVDDPSEATTCPVATPGCTPGVNCCEIQPNRLDRRVCDLGTM